MTNANHPRVWLITGVSSGIGRATAEAALARGDIVIGTVRQAAQVTSFESSFAEHAQGRVHAALLDVTQGDSIPSIIASIVARYGVIDVLVNNAGFGMVGAIEETTLDEARKIFETNFFGLLGVTSAVLPAMRLRRSGHIINISSGAGIGAVPSLGLYSATKFAVEGLNEALALEVAALGIRVSLVEPGAVQTNFPNGSIYEAPGKIADYAPISGHGRAGIQHFYQMQSIGPDVVARGIMALADNPNAPLRLIVGADACAGVQRKLDQLRAELDFSNATAPTLATQA